ncbi:MAG TPA: zinc ABC transporter substrate-binding protein [Sulfolobales archaeon]|nr:zinc ABC transporter substrate-binding protein [Sulfolobales archaeon]
MGKNVWIRGVSLAGLLLILFALLAPGYIVYKTYAQSDQGERIIVTTTHPFLASLVKLIGGVYVDVINAIPTGIDPHEYEPPTDVIRRIGSSDIIIIDTLHHLPISDRIYELYRDKSVVLIDELLKAGWKPEKIPGTDVENLHEVFFDKEALVTTIDIVSSILTKAASDKGLKISEYISAKSEEVKRALLKSFAEAQRIMKNLGIDSVALYSPVLYYLMRSLGVNVSIVLTPDPETEPSPPSLQALRSRSPGCLLVASDLEHTDINKLSESLSPFGISVIPIEALPLDPLDLPIFPLSISSRLIECAKINTPITGTNTSAASSVTGDQQLYLSLTGSAVLGLIMGFTLGFLLGKRYGGRSS